MDKAPEPGENSGAGLANPAAVYCEEQGGKGEIRTDPAGNQYGVCIFDDGSECGQWAFFRGECKPGDMEQAPVP
jgi:putative hemolysin